MEPSSAPASSPRVYVPINHPDSPVPTYAVLQLVGYSDPSLQHPDSSLVITSAGRSSFLSSANSATREDTCAGNFDTRAGIPLSAGLMETLKADAAGSTEVEGLHPDVHLSTQENHSPENSSAGNPSPQGSSTGKSFCSDNPSPRGSCIDSSTSCSLSKGFDKRAVSIKPSPMKKSGIAGPSVANVGVKKCSKVGSAGGPISISVSHTEKETIVHAHSSNFREVVHQLTGASGDDGDLLPVTVPSRASVNRGNGDDANGGCLSRHEGVMKCEYTGRLLDLGSRKPVPTKLFERRRSSKMLERITTSCRDLPPLVPSPVTPLASDFEKICLPVTPTASPVSSSLVPAQEHSIGQLHPTSLRQNGSVQLYSSYNQPAMYMHANMNHSQYTTENPHSGVSEPHSATVLQTACSQREASIEDFVIAEKGFFLHPQRPRNSEPALLPLFPESPRGQ